MEQKYLIDTNCAIDYLNNMLPESGADLIEDTLLQISIISRMELLGWPNAKPGDVVVLQGFIDASTVFNPDEPTVLKAIELRRNHRIKLPDAIIAATAIVHGLILLTRNTSDFKEIQDLKLFNPHL